MAEPAIPRQPGSPYGRCAGSTPARIAVAVDQSGLAAGIYSGRVLLNTTDGKQNIVTVTLNVIAADPSLTSRAGYLRFAGSPSRVVRSNRTCCCEIPAAVARSRF